MKTDARRFRFYILLMLYVALLGFPILLIYNSIYKSFRIDAESFVMMYVFLACMQAIILMFIVPALTATCITGEREKQTLDILLTTKMSPRSIIWGKLMGAMSKVILLIICTMPVYALVLFMGGIRMIHIITCNLYLMMTAVFVGSMCIWISTMVKTSKFANVSAYFFELAFIIGIPVGLMVWANLSNILYDDTIKNVNDMRTFLMNALCVSPATGYGHLLASQLTGNGNLFNNISGSNVTMIMPGWLISIAVEVVFTIVFIEAAIRKLNPHKRKHLKKAKMSRSFINE